MSVDFPPSYSANTPQVNKPVDLKTLQEAFSVAMGRYRNAQGGEGSQTDAMLEVISPSPQAEGSDEDDRQQRREIQKQENRNDFTQIDRTLQNKSELRQDDLETDYQNRIDRHASLRNDHLAKTHPQQYSTAPMESPPLPRQTHAAPWQEPLSRENPLPPHQTNTAAIETSNRNLSPITPAHPRTEAARQPAGISASASVSIPVSHASASLPVPAAAQTIVPHAFTIFTTSGRLGQPQEHSEENEKEKDEEKEDTAEGNTAKKRSPFADLHAIHMEAARPIRQNSARQLQESPLQTDLVRKEEDVRKKMQDKKPRDTDSDPLSSINNSPNVNTLHELLQPAEQKVAEPQQDESHSSNSSFYLNRIAAACEAASMYAPIRIKINLEHLGTLTLRLDRKTNKADELALRFETPTKETERFLHHHLDKLKSILAKRNTKIASLEVIRQEK